MPISMNLKFRELMILEFWNLIRQPNVCGVIADTWDSLMTAYTGKAVNCNTTTQIYKFSF